MKKGFTLAEVLITLTIIGVVAAVTLPSLQNNVNKQALEKQTLKTFNTIVEAHDRYLANNHLDNINAGFIKPDNIRKYFNVVAQCELDGDECTYTSNAEFFPEEDSSGDVYTTVNGDRTYAAKGDIVSQLADGTVISFYYFPKREGFDNALLRVGFDVNGKKGPNVAGYDAWDVPIVIPEDGGPDRYVWSLDDKDMSGNDINVNTCVNYSDRYGCFAHFMRNGFKFDY